MCVCLGVHTQQIAKTIIPYLFCEERDPRHPSGNPKPILHICIICVSFIASQLIESLLSSRIAAIEICMNIDTLVSIEMRKKGYASLRYTEGFFLTMFMLSLTLCLLEWRLRLPLVVVARLVLCFLVQIFQSTALIASVFVCVYRCKTKTHYFNMIDSLHIKTKQNAKFTRPQVGTARKERQRQQQAVFMLGG